MMAARRPTRAKYLKVLKISMQTALTYRANTAMRFVFYALFLYVFFNLWRAIYAHGSVDGYTFQQMIWYLCVTELISFGANTRIWAEISEDVKSGAVAYQLNRPYRYVTYQFVNALGGILLNLALFSALAVVIGMVLVGPIAGLNPATLPLAVLSMLVGIGINFFVMMILGLCAFRLEDVGGLYLVYSKLVFMLGTFIPVEFLPNWLQWIARILPFSYVSWAPARLMVGFDMRLFLEVFPVQVVYLLAAVIGAEMLYRYGVRGIQAHGG